MSATEESNSWGKRRNRLFEPGGLCEGQKQRSLRKPRRRAPGPGNGFLRFRRSTPAFEAGGFPQRTSSRVQRRRRQWCNNRSSPHSTARGLWSGRRRAVAMRLIGGRPSFGAEIGAFVLEAANFRNGRPRRPMSGNGRSLPGPNRRRSRHLSRRQMIGAGWRQKPWRHAC